MNVTHVGFVERYFGELRECLRIPMPTQPWHGHSGIRQGAQLAYIFFAVGERGAPERMLPCSYYLAPGDTLTLTIDDRNGLGAILPF